MVCTTSNVIHECSRRFPMTPENDTLYPTWRYSYAHRKFALEVGHPLSSYNIEISNRYTYTYAHSLAFAYAHTRIHLYTHTRILTRVRIHIYRHTHTHTFCTPQHRDLINVFNTHIHSFFLHPPPESDGYPHPEIPRYAKPHVTTCVKLALHFLNFIFLLIVLHCATFVLICVANHNLII